MADKKLLEYINAAISRELQVSIQYMWQHVVSRGMRSPAIKAELKKIAVTEMKHAEKLAERLDFLGGNPTTVPEKITVGLDLKKIMEINAKAEKDAIKLYKEAIDHCAKINDSTTRRMFEEILAEEEEHLDFFQTMLEGN